MPGRSGHTGCSGHTGRGGHTGCSGHTGRGTCGSSKSCIPERQPVAYRRLRVIVDSMVRDRFPGPSGGITWLEEIPVFGEPVENAVEQIRMVAANADRVALMADHHLGYSMPIGGVAAYRDLVSPSGVGFDIACGNKAVRLDLAAGGIAQQIPQIMDEIFHTISFGMGRKNPEPVEHPLFHDDPAWAIPAVADLYDLARKQLGTVGGGNHYVDLFRDEEDRVWVGVHFGSRGFGHKIATHYLDAGAAQARKAREGAAHATTVGAGASRRGAAGGMNAPPVLIDADTNLGEEYLAAMNLAGRYAYAGRDWVCERVAELLGAPILEEVHNHHNFTWRETHFGEDYWVVRKGATPAFPGQLGFVGGSMGEPSVILRGLDSEESRMGMYSTVHGAGRVMSRRAAAGKKNYRRGRGKKKRRGSRDEPGGLVTPEMMREWVQRAGVELRGGGVDESPHCYRRLEDVLAAHAGTIEILHRLVPMGVAMAPADEWDPYKD
jgi:tRNA-splicing ligase RtcB (3'-phosphate/5'-hydroxy nucleic acid ligase)